MTAREKVLRYLSGRKRAVPVSTICSHFLISDTVARRALLELETQGKARRFSVSRQDFWSIVHTMAIPENAPQLPKPPTLKSSFPHARGYDD